ncbi:type IV toxin-antitoxin system AbiEi family antitoxin domain-containing protein [Pseudofrankia saprophytica]|uniref:type IV toxin-antitoxin system AbiEi family antitoxin domain-containing protein n=1 Tax=Pseudofrankia saprophytica TaxID=298655 RepID=UPI003CC9181F
MSAQLLSATRLARLQDGMITYRQALDAGLTPEEIRVFVARGWWWRPVHGTYIIRYVVGLPPRTYDCVESSPRELRGCARAALAARPNAVICGPTAARLLGFAVLAEPVSHEPVHHEPVHVMERGRGSLRPTPGTTPHRGNLRDADIVTIMGLPVTSAARTVADLALWASSREDAVSLIDTALHGGQLSDVAAARAATTGRPGCRRVDSWWALADGRSESPLETRVRLLLVDRGLPPEELQWLVTGADGRFVARVRPRLSQPPGRHRVGWRPVPRRPGFHRRPCRPCLPRPPSSERTDRTRLEGHPGHLVRRRRSAARGDRRDPRRSRLGASSRQVTLGSSSRSTPRFHLPRRWLVATATAVAARTAAGTGRRDPLGRGPQRRGSVATMTAMEGAHQ